MAFPSRRGGAITLRRSACDVTQDQNSGGVCATFQGPREDRAVDEAQLRRHLPAGQRLCHCDPRHHDDAAVLSGVRQQSGRRLPLQLSLRRLGQRRDVMPGVTQRLQLAAIGRRERVVKPTLPAACFLISFFTVEVHALHARRDSRRVGEVHRLSRKTHKTYAGK